MKILQTLMRARLGLAIGLLPGMVGIVGAPHAFGKTKQLIMLSASRARPSQRQITAWIHALVGLQGPMRTRATVRLTAACDSALPAIKKALAGKASPHLRQRLHAILDAIVAGDVLRGPSVTLHLRKAMLADVINALCKQGGFQANLFPVDRSGAPIPQYFYQKRLTINVRRRPFWAVMRRFAKITGVGPGVGAPMYSELSFDSFRSVFRRHAPIDISGAFLVEIQYCTFNRKIRFDRAPGHRLSRSLHLRFNVVWCPGHRKILGIGPLRILQATDNIGRVLASASLPAGASGTELRAYRSGWRQTGFTFGAIIHRPAAGAKVISTLRARIPIVIQTAPETYTAGNLSSGGAKLGIDGMQLLFGKPTKAHGAWRTHRNTWLVPLAIRVRAHLDRKLLLWRLVNGGSEKIAFQTFRGRYLKGPLWRVRKGVPPGRYAVYPYGGAPESARVTVSAREVMVPVEFHNVPLPR